VDFPAVFHSSAAKQTSSRSSGSDLLTFPFTQRRSP
jgi:hypothetical protein